MSKQNGFTTEDYGTLLNAVGLGPTRAEHYVGSSWVDFCERHPTLPTEQVLNILILISTKQNLQKQKILSQETHDLLAELQDISTPIRNVPRETVDALSENTFSLTNAIAECNGGIRKQIDQILKAD